MIAKKSRVAEFLDKEEFFQGFIITFTAWSVFTLLVGFFKKNFQLLDFLCWPAKSNFSKVTHFAYLTDYVFQFDQIYFWEPWFGMQ